MINEPNWMWKETIASILRFNGTIFLGYLCFFLKWGENLSLGSTVVSAPIVLTADDRRVNEYRTSVKKTIYREDLYIDIFPRTNPAVKAPESNQNLHC